MGIALAADAFQVANTLPNQFYLLLAGEQYVTEPGSTYIQQKKKKKSVTARRKSRRRLLELVALDLASGGLKRLSAGTGDVEDLAVAPELSAGSVSLNRVLCRGAVPRSGSRAKRTLPLRRRRLCYDAWLRWSPTFAWSPDGARIALSLTDATCPLGCLAGRGRRLGDAPVDLGVRVRRTAADLASSPASCVTPPSDGRRYPAFVYRPLAAARDGTAPALLSSTVGPRASSSRARPRSFSISRPAASWLSRQMFAEAPSLLLGKPTATCAIPSGDPSCAVSGGRSEWPAPVVSSSAANRGDGGSYGGYMALAALTDRPVPWAARCGTSFGPAS